MTENISLAGWYDDFFACGKQQENAKAGKESMQPEGRDRTMLATAVEKLSDESDAPVLKVSQGRGFVVLGSRGGRGGDTGRHEGRKSEGKKKKKDTRLVMSQYQV